MAGGVKQGKLIDLAGVGVDVEGPGLRALAEGGDEAGAVDGEEDRISRDRRARETRKDAAGVLRIEGEAIEHDLNVWRTVQSGLKLWSLGRAGDGGVEGGHG